MPVNDADETSRVLVYSSWPLCILDPLPQCFEASHVKVRDDLKTFKAVLDDHMLKELFKCRFCLLHVT